MIVPAANTHDSAAGVALLDQAAERTGGTAEKALVHQGFKNQVLAHGAGLGIHLEIAERKPQEKACVSAEAVEVERTYGILILHRRLVRDHEHRPSHPLPASAGRCPTSWPAASPARTPP
nr:hypothetical protein [Streptomyces sp. Ag109_G2-6]